MNASGQDSCYHILCLATCHSEDSAGQHSYHILIHKSYPKKGLLISNKKVSVSKCNTKWLFTEVRCSTTSHTLRRYRRLFQLWVIQSMSPRTPAN